MVILRSDTRVPREDCFEIPRVCCLTTAVKHQDLTRLYADCAYRLTSAMLMCHLSCYLMTLVQGTDGAHYCIICLSMRAAALPLLQVVCRRRQGSEMPLSDSCQFAAVARLR